MGKGSAVHDYTYGEVHSGYQDLYAARFTGLVSDALKEKVDPYFPDVSIAREALSRTVVLSELDGYLRQLQLSPDVRKLQIPIEPQLDMRVNTQNKSVMLIASLALTKIPDLEPRVIRAPMFHKSDAKLHLVIGATPLEKTQSEFMAMRERLVALRQEVKEEVMQESTLYHIRSLDVKGHLIRRRSPDQ